MPAGLRVVGRNLLSLIVLAVVIIVALVVLLLIGVKSGMIFPPGRA